MTASVKSAPRHLAPGRISDSELGRIWNLCTAEQIIDGFVDGFDPGRRARDRACWRALALLGDEAAGDDTPRAALVAFARDVLAELAVEVTSDLPALRKLICRLERSAGIPVLELGCEMLRAPQLLRLAAAVAIDVELKLLLAFTPAISVTLWTLSSTGQPEQLARAGNAELPDRRVRRLALRLLSGEDACAPADSDIAGVPIDTAHGRVVLVSRGSGAAALRHLLLLESAVPVLTAALARYHTSPQTGNGTSREMGPAERRLARLRFDLHDGPQQDLILLAEDLRLFRSQLDSALAGAEIRECVRGRLDDLEAQLIAVDADLRRISVSAESPFLGGASLPEALAQLIDAFEQRTGVTPELRLRGDFTDLTDSQQIALLGLIREALSNIRKHADAEHVIISLSSDSSGVIATVTDDGCGFDPDAALVKAAGGGHLGLVGMHERVRMLGGQTRIDSRPGGPTVVSVSLPGWPAVVAQRD